MLYSNDSPEPQIIDPDSAATPRSNRMPKLTGQPYLDALLQEIRGAAPESLSLSTQEVATTMRATLWAQHVADSGQGVDVPWAAS